jgi:hypothetical protein
MLLVKSKAQVDKITISAATAMNAATYCHVTAADASAHACVTVSYHNTYTTLESVSLHQKYLRCAKTVGNKWRVTYT